MWEDAGDAMIPGTEARQEAQQLDKRWRDRPPSHRREPRSHGASLLGGSGLGTPVLGRRRAWEVPTFGACRLTTGQTCLVRAPL